MDILEEKLENQVQFWSLLGPFVILLSLGVLLFKASVHWYFPLSLLIGIPLCVKWKMRGMVGALCSLFFLSLFAYSSLDWDERYWHVGMALAMAFSFIVLTLSLEEVEGLVQKLKAESHSRLDNFLRLDEKWQCAEKEWEAKKEIESAQSAALSGQIEKLAEEKDTFYKLAQLAKDELLQVRTQYERVQGELVYKKHEIANLYERIDETERTIQGFVDSNAQKRIEELINQVSCLQREEQEQKAQLIEAMKAKEEWEEEQQSLWEKEKKELSHRYHQECLVFEQEIRNKQETFESILEAFKTSQKELEGKSEKLRLMQKQGEQFQCELHAQQELLVKKEEELEHLKELKCNLEKSVGEYQAEIASIKDQLKTVSSCDEKAFFIDGNTRTIEARYVQLRQQFEEKSAILDSTRRELFKGQEELLKRKKENEEEQLFTFSEQEQRWQAHLLEWGECYEEMENDYKQEIVQLSKLIDRLLDVRPLA